MNENYQLKGGKEVEILFRARVVRLKEGHVGVVQVLGPLLDNCQEAAFIFQDVKNDSKITMVFLLKKNLLIPTEVFHHFTEESITRVCF